MLRIMKSRCLIGILAFLLAISLLPAVALQTYAEQEQENPSQTVIAQDELLGQIIFEETESGTLDGTQMEPLDFISDQTSRSGEGWSWDLESATLTLNNLVLNLTKYTEEYSAAILLPALPNGVKLVLVSGNRVGVSGVAADNEAHLGIYAEGDLTIEGGEGKLNVVAIDGANGIETGGNLTINNVQGSEELPGMVLLGMDYCLAAGDVLQINNSEITAGISGTNEDPSAAKYTLIGVNTNKAENGVEITD